jgi:2-dehydropantoate 2-reductase
MRIAIFGAGGVGGYFGAKLAASGSDVTFIARGAHLAAMKAHGLRVQSPLGDFTVDNVHAIENVADAGPIDVAMVAVKLWATEEAAQALAPLAERGTAVVSFQNGVYKEEVFRRYLPEGSIMGGASYISAIIAEPGVIRQNGKMQGLAFGEYDGSQSERALALLAACEKAGIDAKLSTSIERVVWEKFVFLVGLSASTAVMRKPIGPIRENPQTRAFLLDVMKEVVAVGRARGVPLAEDFAETRLDYVDTLPASMTASMHHDLTHGNRLEVPWLSGGVAAYGRELGLPTPCNRAVADILALYADGSH